MSAAPTDCRAPDPTDAKADGAFGGHRAGYSPDKLANAEKWARKGGTLNAGEGAILCEEIDRLREALKHETRWTDAYIESSTFLQQQLDDLTKKLAEVTDERNAAEANAERRWDDIILAAKKIDRLQAILAALREPSEAIMKGAVLHYSGDMQDAIRAAVAAAEQEVQGAS